MHKYKRIALYVLTLLLIASGGFVVWASRPAMPMPAALDALQSDEQVQVQNGPWLTFQPVHSDPAVGLIFYPGGLVDPRAYAPQARAIANRGYLVVIVPMPLNLAFFAPDNAKDVIAEFPSIRRWAIGGHSLGGVAASMFVKRHPEMVQGLALWASYPTATDNLVDYNLNVVSIYGTQDRLSSEDKIAASRPLLPRSTRWVPIEGGNHGQFGWYGGQSGDGEAKISREAQQAEIVQATVELLSGLQGG
jgi:pimeloyl-ACP methyl ester carboxylesterase